MKKLIITLIVSVLLFGITTGGFPDDKEEKKKDILASKQKEIEKMVVHLKKSMLNLVKILKKTEPENAAKLMRALKKINKKFIVNHLREIAKLLQKQDTGKAMDEQDKVLESMNAILRLLREEDDASKRKKEIARLEKLKKELDKIIKKLKTLKGNTNKAAKKMSGIKALQESVDMIKKLIETQKEIMKKTPKSEKIPKNKSSKLFNEQDTLEQIAKKLSMNLHGKGEAQNKASKALKKAAKSMGNAKGNLKKGKGSSAKKGQKNALKHLKDALKNLEKELKKKRKILKLPELEKLKKKQKELEMETKKLEKEMKGKDGKNPAPGKDSVKGAGKSMNKAKKNLGKKQPGRAEENQKDALDKLKQAKEELEERLAQLKREMQDEILEALENRFRRMLIVQKKISKKTKKMNDLKIDKKSEYNRLERIELKKLGEKERALAKESEIALAILKEEGSTVVFPSIVEGLRNDFLSVAKLLEKYATNEFTQDMQKEIERTLNSLIEALKKERKRRDEDPSGRGGGGGGKPKDEKLVPLSAELKMIKELQLRVNRMTKKFDKSRKENLSDAEKVQVKIMSNKQNRVSKITEELGRKLAKEEDE